MAMICATFFGKFDRTRNIPNISIQHYFIAAFNINGNTFSAIKKLLFNLIAFFLLILNTLPMIP